MIKGLIAYFKWKYLSTKSRIFTQEELESFILYEDVRSYIQKELRVAGFNLGSRGMTRNDRLDTLSIEFTQVPKWFILLRTVCK